MRPDIFRSLLLLLGMAALALAANIAQAAAPNWTVDQKASKLTFSGTHAGEAFNGTFGKWDSRIIFDPKQLKGSRIIIVVATSSAQTSDPVRESSLKNDEWFDPAHFPTAIFASNDIRARGGNNYAAVGTLTIKGKKFPLTVPFTAKINGTKATAQGSLVLDRIDLGLGLASDPNAEWVSRKINLTFSLSASR